MLSEEDLTYTQMLTKLDLDTGHLNYYLESLGELLTKTDDGNYKLSEFGRAALGLMSGVEDSETGRKGPEEGQRSRRGITRWSMLIPVIALVAAGIILMNVSYVSTSSFSRTGSLDIDDARIVQPNATITNRDWINVDEFPEDTLTAHYRTFFQIDIAYTNVTLQIQLTELDGDIGRAGSNVEQLPLLIYNETWSGPLFPEEGTRLSYTIKVPLASPKEQGFILSGFTVYETYIINLGKETLGQNSSSNEETTLLPSNTGSFSLQTSYPVIEETNYPYFYFGAGFLVWAAVTIVLSFVPKIVRLTGKQK
jgi:hypothetical protein